MMLPDIYDLCIFICLLVDAMRQLGLGAVPSGRVDTDMFVSVKLCRLIAA